ncbi:3-hydroxyacyl-CoA dehydrogenase type-2 (modular protein) [Cupriavidus taiwanensis]|uniref:3-hydroxyacyl-CoA dehydrogenase type-2 (Modular protein) n=2 Tax=Cupriavidus TaxID=106589 RepID=A0A375GNW9_9BURK|nr:3-hydroxyacyl-CoA dehydrogenase type-2 (modular protein) [Cupriavidus taiwanensis]SOZ40740.1 3-hydroxyacyl-CoA dehydrogenase type-2 (modular protein) [Cupriavidus neocaledonicus]SOY76791.1 3-hydroxyacyl-CoA dehydrogenase type-2 (modular protein) [Cupriavidus taiwanensis]SOY76792.1 3-hydroxyacyl-CoA dehydrogenase type-2 (modular protein) [Cupriavidus taiwanensis]SOY77195.1 3-hydroxyacyl-CoA dehydrogenase type-2 (modular protein) [Cupriavidus taiwanensis]
MSGSATYNPGCARGVVQSDGVPFILGIETRKSRIALLKKLLIFELANQLSRRRQGVEDINNQRRAIQSHQVRTAMAGNNALGVGDVFVVTGAGSGLGAATAMALAEAGAKVVVVDLDSNSGQVVARQVGGIFVRADVTKEESVKQIFDYAKALGPLRGLVNCAGVAPAEKVIGKSGVHGLASFQRVLEINVAGTFNVLRLSAALMAEQQATGDGERGVIVNTASVAAFDGQVGQSAYAASKGAVVAMTLPLARELARFGIRVVTIAPGIMATPLLLAMPDEVQKSLGASVPFPPRLGKPQEFADLVKHVIGNSYLNGEVIRLDGAIRMAAK